MPIETRIYPGAPGASPELCPGPSPGRNGSPSDRADSPSPSEALGRLGSLAGELKEYFSYYLSTKVDGVKLTARNIGLYAVLGLVGLIVGGTILVTSAVLLINGAATGLGWLFGGRFWLGQIVVALLVLGGVALGAYLALTRLTRTFHQQTVKKYEERQRWQRDRFGRDVHQAASR